MMKKQSVQQRSLIGDLIQLIVGGGGAREDSLEIAPLKLKQIPKGESGERKGVDG